MQPLNRNQAKMPVPAPVLARTLAAAEVIGWGMAGIVLARALWLAVTPAGPLGTPPLAAAASASPMALAGSDPFYPQGASAPDAVSALDLALVGTRVDAASARGSAIIATPDGRQQSFAVGDEIMPGVRLVAVAFESVTLDRGGARETLYIDQSPTSPGQGMTVATAALPPQVITPQPPALPPGANVK